MSDQATDNGCFISVDEQQKIRQQIVDFLTKERGRTPGLTEQQAALVADDVLKELTGKYSVQGLDCYVKATVMVLNQRYFSPAGQRTNCKELDKRIQAQDT